jgi:hypothetical protein
MALRLGARAYQGEIDYADFPDIPQRQPGTSLENPS